MVDGTSAAERARQYRQRQAAGVQRLPIDVYPDVAESLIERGWCSDEELADKQQLAAIIADVLHCWASATLTADPINRANAVTQRERCDAKSPETDLGSAAESSSPRPAQ